MSEDLYFYAISCSNLPSHIRDSYNFLVKSKNNPQNMLDSNEKILLERLLFLQDKKDLFANSCLGAMTIKQLL